MPEIITQPQPTSNQKSINWKRILIVAVIAAVVIGLGVLILVLLQPKPETTSTVTTKKATPSAKISTPSANKNDGSDVVQGEVWKALEQQQKVSVIISLNVPKLPENKNGLETYKSDIKIVQDRVLSLLAHEDFNLTHQYEAVPGLAGRMTKKGLESIMGSKDVMTVGLDKAVKIEPGV